TYGTDFYAGHPALTRNHFGQGQAYYIAARTEQRFLDEFYGTLVGHLGIHPVIDTVLPDGVSVTQRSDGSTCFVFVMNFTDQAVKVKLDVRQYSDLLTGDVVSGDSIELPAYGICILTVS